MRRSLWSRWLACWLACWLPLVLADGGWVHACPMHDGTPPVAGRMMQAMSPPVAGPLVAGPLAARRAADDHGAGPHHTAGHACTCLGACCAAVAALPVRPEPVMVAVVERAYVAPTGRPAHEYVAAWVDFVLPFATAPPVRG